MNVTAVETSSYDANVHIVRYFDATVLNLCCIFIIWLLILYHLYVFGTYICILIYVKRQRRKRNILTEMAVELGLGKPVVYESYISLRDKMEDNEEELEVDNSDAVEEPDESFDRKLSLSTKNIVFEVSILMTLVLILNFLLNLMELFLAVILLTVIIMSHLESFHTWIMCAILVWFVKLILGLLEVINSIQIREKYNSLDIVSNENKQSLFCEITSLIVILMIKINIIGLVFLYYSGMKTQWT